MDWLSPGLAASMACSHHPGEGSKANVGLLIKDLTVEKLVAEPKQLLVHIRWQGWSFGRSLRTASTQHRRPAALPCHRVERVRELAQALLDVQIADQLNREGSQQRQR